MSRAVATLNQRRVLSYFVQKFVSQIAIGSKKASHTDYDMGSQLGSYTRIHNQLNNAALNEIERELDLFIKKEYKVGYPGRLETRRITTR